jgi:hypothetical protein
MYCISSPSFPSSYWFSFGSITFLYYPICLKSRYIPISVYYPRANGAERRSPGEGTNSARLFTPGERNAQAKYKVHQLSWAHGYDLRVDLLTDLKNMADLPVVG